MYLSPSLYMQELGLGVDLVTELWAEDTFMELFKQVTLKSSLGLF